jgi:hypothetical protein
MKIDPYRDPKFLQQLQRQITEARPEVVNQAYVEEQKKIELKRIHKEMRKKTEELEKIKEYHTVNKTSKTKLDGQTNKIKINKEKEIDQII